jgi:uridine kinase
MSLMELRTVSVESARVILLAGPSGSGKSYVARRTSLPVLCLDDFYKDGNDPTLPRAHGQIDWDAVLAWNSAVAVSAVVLLARCGMARVPIYDISCSTSSDDRLIRIDDSPLFIAEGIFAAEIVDQCAAAGVLADALAIRRPGAVNFVRRLARDLREHRKPPGVLIRRGLRLWRRDRAILRRQVRLGCKPMSARRILRHIGQLTHSHSAVLR